MLSLPGGSGGRFGSTNLPGILFRMPTSEEDHWQALSSQISFQMLRIQLFSQQVWAAPLSRVLCYFKAGCGSWDTLDDCFLCCSSYSSDFCERLLFLLSVLLDIPLGHIHPLLLVALTLSFKVQNPCWETLLLLQKNFKKNTMMFSEYHFCTLGYGTAIDC